MNQREFKRLVDPVGHGRGSRYGPPRWHKVSYVVGGYGIFGQTIRAACRDDREILEDTVGSLEEVRPGSTLSLCKKCFQ